MQPDTSEQAPGHTLPLSQQGAERGPPQSSKASSSPTTNAPQSDGEGHVVAKRELSRILVHLSAFISHIALVNNTISSEYSPLIHFTVSTTTLCLLGQILGEWFVASITLVAAIILSLIDIYTGESVAVFVSTVVATFLGAMVFLLANVLHNADASWCEIIQGSKLFMMSNVLLKVLLTYGIIPISGENGQAVMDELQCAFFVISFILSVMALMLHASGVPILSPIRRTSLSLTSKNCSAIMASVLYWTGATTTVANVIIIAVRASAETPIVIKVACAVFAVCTTALVLKAPTNPED